MRALSPRLPERGARGENGLCLLSLRQNKNPSFPGHAPGKDTLRAANAATKERFTGRKQNKRSEFCCLPVLLLCLPVLILSHVLPERVARRENIRASFCAARMLSLRQNKKSVFSRTCAGKRHLKSRERGDERGGNGEKTE